MPPSSELLKYRIIWMIGSLILLVSLFFPYIYDETLIGAIQPNLSKMFNAFGEPTWENIAFTISAVGFILLVLGGAICLIFSAFAYKEIRIWNAAILGLLGVLLLSSPILIFQNGNLVEIRSVTGIQYSPNFEGLGIGYYITWIGVLMSLVSGDLTLKHRPESPEPPKKMLKKGIS